MLSNPFLPAPSQARAWAEGFIKGFESISSPEPGVEVGPDDVEAFNQGVADGSGCATNGFVLDNPCVPARAEELVPESAYLVWDGMEFFHGLFERIAAKWAIGTAAEIASKVAAGYAGMIVPFIEIVLTSTVSMLPPEQVLPSLGQPMMDLLASFGLDSLELFCGAGLDLSAADCEILLTPLFKSVDQARQAATDMNRPQWIVVSWRTDQSNSFRVVDSQ